jgi:hypothetical protein
MIGRVSKDRANSGADIAWTFTVEPREIGDHVTIDKCK